MVEIEEFFGQRRTVYRQLDGSTILADLCECWEDPLLCPIDDHAIAARQRFVAVQGTEQAGGVFGGLVGQDKND